MTLIVGIKCEDGVVMAADSAATMNVPLGPVTVCQKYSKLFIVGNLILGTSGPVGLGQAFCEEIDVLLKNRGDKCNWKRSLDAKNELRAAMWKHAEKEWDSARMVANVIGPQAAQAAMSQTLAAFPIGDVPTLIQFDHKCSPEEATDHLPFASIGCGQPLADPYLAFIRRLLWPTGLPKLQVAVFSALWALGQAIRVAPEGIAAPIQVVTLSKGGGSWAACELVDPDLDEHKVAIQAVDDAIRDKLLKLGGDEGDAVPKPPTPTVTESGAGV